MRKTIMFLLFVTCFSPAAKAVSDSPEITAVPGQVNPYKTRSELLMDATAYTGVFTPEQAVAVWAKGLEKRSAAMQYIVMTDKLKKEYAGQLDELRSNWVTGMSSPSVVDYMITGVNKTDDTHAVIDLKIEIAATWSPSSEFYDASFWLVNENGFWRIDRIVADKELYYYTFYQP